MNGALMRPLQIPVTASTPPTSHADVPERPAAGYEPGEEDEGDEERGGVDQEHGRGARHRDQKTGQRRPEHDREALRAAEKCIRLAEQALVLAEQLRQDRPL